MKFTLFALATVAASASAFSPTKGGSAARTKPAVKSTVDTADSSSFDSGRPIRDPFGLYPANSPERLEGRIQPLEPPIQGDKTIIDPLNLYASSSDSSAVATAPDMSASLPFLNRPEMLDGSLPGDRGFDPFNFSSNERSLQWYRNAEIKHARLAMLAAVGWPLAELFNKSVDRAPSVLNGGLEKISPVFWATLLTVLSAVEVLGIVKDQDDYGFDPLGLFGRSEEDRKFKLDAEIFNGRLAMLAIFGFAMQEFVTKIPVIEQTPLFFKPIWEALT